MKRPFLTRILPNRLKRVLYYRWYRTRHSHFPGLFDNVSLELAPQVSMHGLVVGDAISGSLAFLGFYEWDLSAKIVEMAEKATTFVDVGANMGYYSLLWAGTNPKGRVLAFEVSPRNITILQNNIDRNNLTNQITVIPKAAGHHQGTIKFDVGPSEQTGWGGITSTSSATTMEVPMVRLDEELPDIEIDVLKIDVEGADTWVLFGCEKLLREKRIRTIFFEQNIGRMKVLGITANEAVDFLESLDYVCVPFGAGESEWIAYPKS